MPESHKGIQIARNIGHVDWGENRKRKEVKKKKRLSIQMV